jgi:molecular chaperone DnaK
MGTDKKITLNKKDYLPEDISSMILTYLCQEAKNLEQVDVSRVVITVPAYFSEAQRRATIKAGEQAGLTVERIINEPTAAALFYDLIQDGRQDSEWENALVYDLGGGTFDVSVLRMETITEVLASTGDTQLGGDDFDALITDLLLKQIREKYKTDLANYRPAVARLNAAAENAKMILSTKGTTTIEETMISGPDGETFSVSLELLRPELEHLVEHLVDRSLGFVMQALKESGLNPKDIDRVLLVGGMTKMPLISEKLALIFGNSQLPIVDPDLSVANGAAIQGGLITGENAEQVLIDVTSHTLSLKALDETHELRCVPIIPRNTPIPASRSQIFATCYPDQEMGMVCVYQGESTNPSENELIGEAPLYLSKASSKTPIEVEYSYDINGMIHVVAEQKGFKKRMEIDLDTRNPSGPASNSPEIDARSPELYKILEKELKKFASADKSRGPQKLPIKTNVSEAGWNFAIKRAKNLLEILENKDDIETLTQLLDKYTSALSEEHDDLDDIEDELLNFMENLQL